MDEKHLNKISELFYRNQTNQNYNFIKRGFIRAKVGKRKIDIRFPIQHLFYLPRQISDTILQHISNVGKIQFDFHEQKINDFIFDYYLNNYYEDILQNREETLKLWRTFNKNKYWRYNEPTSEAEKCIKRMEEKWKNGIDDFEQEIQFIRNNIDQFIEKKEEIIKQIPFEIKNMIFQELPEKIKIEWIKNIIPEVKEDIKKTRKIEEIGGMNIEKMKEEEIKELIDFIISKSEDKLVGKLNHRFQEFQQTITDKENILKEVREREERIKRKKQELQTLLDNKEKLIREIKEERKMKEEDRINEEERKRKEKERMIEEERKRKEKERIIEEERKRKENIEVVKELIKRGGDINAKDWRKRRRDKEIHH